jgi:hypothetical protein
MKISKQKLYPSGDLNQGPKWRSNSLTMAAGGRRGDTAQALDRWRHPVASSEALDVLHQAMRPASYRCIAMAIENYHRFACIFCCRRFVIAHYHS